MTTQATFSEALQKAKDFRIKYTESMQGHYEQAQRDLNAIDKKLKRARKRQGALETLQRNYQMMQNMESTFGGRLSSYVDLLPKDCREKLGSIGAEMRRTKYFGDCGFAYSNGQRSHICRYIGVSAEKLMNRSMTELEYNFLMQNKPRAIVKVLLREGMLIK